MECWNNGMLECWNNGIMECWNNGIMKKFFINRRQTQILYNAPCGVELQTFIDSSVVVISVNCRFVSLNDKRNDGYQVTIQPDD